MQGIDIYEANADALMLEQFVHEHSALVKKIALHIKRKLPSHIELEDLLQAGFVGLLEARQHFNPHLGTTFDTFASNRIHGAIIDSLRKISWGTRETLKNMRLISEATTLIEQREQRPARTEEIVLALEISLDEYMEMCHQISVCNVLSLDAIDSENVLDDASAEDPEEISEQNEVIENIKQFLTTLPKREQLVLSLYYVEEFTFKQIGEILDLTEARICQIHSQAIAKMQTKMQRKENETSCVV